MRHRWKRAIDRCGYAVVWSSRLGWVRISATYDGKFRIEAIA